MIASCELPLISSLKCTHASEGHGNVRGRYGSKSHDRKFDARSYPVEVAESLVQEFLTLVSVDHKDFKHVVPALNREVTRTEQSLNLQSSVVETESKKVSFVEDNHENDAWDVYLRSKGVVRSRKHVRKPTLDNVVVTEDPDGEEFKNCPTFDESGLIPEGDCGDDFSPLTCMDDMPDDLLDAANAKGDKTKKLQHVALVSAQHFNIAPCFDLSEDELCCEDDDFACADLYDSSYINWSLVGSDGHDSLAYLLDDCEKVDYTRFSLFHESTELPEMPLYFESLEEADLFLGAFKGDFVDVCEICGGAAGVSKICLRRRMKTGKNFDIVAGFDLTKSEHISYL